jgi:hypothetical protein
MVILADFIGCPIWRLAVSREGTEALEQFCNHDIRAENDAPEKSYNRSPASEGTGTHPGAGDAPDHMAFVSLAR